MLSIAVLFCSLFLEANCKLESYTNGHNEERRLAHDFLKSFFWIGTEVGGMTFKFLITLENTKYFIISFITFLLLSYLLLPYTILFWSSFLSPRGTGFSSFSIKLIIWKAVLIPNLNHIITDIQLQLLKTFHEVFHDS